MYLPKKYQKTDPNYLLEYITAHPFGSIVSKGERLMATHLPFLTEGRAGNFRLYSHLANHNEQAQYLKDGAEVLLLFQGSHAYISSSWYREKNISTWDYSAVHVNATITLQTEGELRASLEKLVRFFEKDQTQPLMYRDIPSQMLEEHLPLITGFWCEPKKIEGVAKLHQGYEREDIHSVVRQLEGQEDFNAKELARDIKREHKL